MHTLWYILPNLTSPARFQASASPPRTHPLLGWGPKSIAQYRAPCGACSARCPAPRSPWPAAEPPVPARHQRPASLCPSGLFHALASGRGHRTPARAPPPADGAVPARDPDLDRLVEVDGHHLLHAVLDHLGGEEVGLSLLVHGDLAVVLQQDGADGLGGVGHVDGPVVAHHLAEVGERPAVVQVEVAGGAAWSAGHCAPQPAPPPAPARLVSFRPPAGSFIHQAPTVRQAPS